MVYGRFLFHEKMYASRDSVLYKLIIMGTVNGVCGVSMHCGKLSRQICELDIDITQLRPW